MSTADPQAGSDHVCHRPPGGAPFHDAQGDREVAPIRPLNRPQPDRRHQRRSSSRGSLVLAVAIPGLIVSPTATTAPGDKLGLAFGITMRGHPRSRCCTGIFQYRRTGNWVWYLVAATPAFAVFCGGAIFAATKAVA